MMPAAVLLSIPSGDLTSVVAVEGATVGTGTSLTENALGAAASSVVETGSTRTGSKDRFYRDR